MKLYNTLTRQIDELQPLRDKKVLVYTCGLTVYSQPHIGNWVAYIYWDILIRILKEQGYNVTRVQNITDVGHLVSDEDDGEDKMQKGAKREGVTAWDIAKKYTALAEHEAYEELGLLRPDHMPKATDYIQQQINFVKTLEENGFTYLTDDGVYFDTSQLDDYGKLARLNIKGLKAGARVENTNKKNPTDFALWKFSPLNQKRDMEWDSPWGKGFPGWHLECSVMARELLGDQIDIHTGGIDHIPVHHTNEIAQTEAITKKQFAQIWLHANHIKVNGTKISKSLGNGFTIDDIKQKGYDLQAFKLMVLSKHFRTEGNFTWQILEAAQNRLQAWQAAADLRWQAVHAPKNQNQSDTFRTVAQKIVACLENDLDTPQALAEIDQAFTFEVLFDTELDAFTALLKKIQSVLGITILLPDITESQKALIAARDQARNNADWEAADRVRDQLVRQGIILNDTAEGTRWTRIMPAIETK